MVSPTERLEQVTLDAGNPADFFKAATAKLNSETQFLSRPLMFTHRVLHTSSDDEVLWVSC